MPPFFRNDGSQFIYKPRTIGVFLNKGNAGGGRLLFTKSMIRQDFLNGNSGQINPPWIGGKLKAEDVFGAVHGLAIAPIKWIFG
jgi:hypothetical protein